MSEASTSPLTLIRPARRSGLPDFGELWRFRDLAAILAWRDVKVRYKQSLIGIAWAVLQPFLTMVVFTLIFGKFANLPSAGLPYPVFAMLAPRSVDVHGGGVHAHRGMRARKPGARAEGALPPADPPARVILVPLVDFCFSFFVALGITAWYDVRSSRRSSSRRSS